MTIGLSNHVVMGNFAKNSFGGDKWESLIGIHLKKM